MVTILIVTAIITFVGFLIFRTWLHSGSQDKIKEVTFSDIDLNNAADRLSNAVSFETISKQEPSHIDGDQFRKQHEYLKEAFPLVHKHLEREVVNDFSLLYTWKAENSHLKPVMLTSHLDVVPVEPGTETDWEHPPFSGAIRDGYIYGRGTMDVQCGVMAILESVEWMLRQGYKPKRTIYLGFGHDEEVDGDQGAYAISKVLQERNVELEYLLDEGLPIVDGLLDQINNPIALVAIAEKGYMSVELTATAEGGHSSVPQGKTSIAVLSKAIEKLENNPMPAKLDGIVRNTFESMAPSMSLHYRFAIANMWLFKGLLKYILSKMPATNAAMRTTTATTIFESGIKENVLPTQAHAIVNFRIHPNDNIDDVLKHVKNVINDDRVSVRLLHGSLNPSPVSDIEDPNYKNLTKTIRQVFTDVTVSPSLMVAATDARHYTNLTQNIYRFLPIRSVESDLDRVHGTNERLSIDNYGEMIRFYIQMLRNSAVRPPSVGSKKHESDEHEHVTAK